ncbi:uncharacterized protein LOC113147404 [Cyclospora cayetanensis]|uniref:Uncharacterized protein LOC113147404 n=1 Tax=Cyclospora cayetanensis TaxID=88456 RepID=A0A6P6S0F7_9EIME|nr:uncharacterized protein LOC113147404 [Cyclospora cayetanensis]
MPFAGCSAATTISGYLKSFAPTAIAQTSGAQTLGAQTASKSSNCNCSTNGISSGSKQVYLLRAAAAAEVHDEVELRQQQRLGGAASIDPLTWARSLFGETEEPHAAGDRRGASATSGNADLSKTDKDAVYTPHTVARKGSSKQQGSGHSSAIPSCAVSLRLQIPRFVSQQSCTQAASLLRSQRSALKEDYLSKHRAAVRAKRAATSHS